jgi:hypothetical protein
MSEDPDQNLRRLFARAGDVAADEAFVAGVAMRVSAQRSRQRARRLGLTVLAAAAGVLLAVCLAPYAPLSLPDTLARVGDATAHPLPTYLYLVIAAGVLPLAGTAWLLRRR